MLRPFSYDGEGLLLHLGKIDPSRLSDWERGRGLGATRYVHLLCGGQIHRLLQRRGEDALSYARDEGTARPARTERTVEITDSTCRVNINKVKVKNSVFQHYQEGLISALTESGVVRAVDRSLAGELRVKLTHIVRRLLARHDDTQVWDYSNMRWFIQSKQEMIRNSRRLICFP
ncbi:hypothetical protein GOODEAATRI_011882 [Goodea atripinnis]|uniref:Uncharacterized protein n=1 Tax=Goodea atripinnis TaxID=208336 RepID=A0ABV0NJG8_9TELE